MFSFTLHIFYMLHIINFTLYTLNFLLAFSFLPTRVQACHSSSSLTLEDAWVKLVPSPSLPTHRLVTLDRLVVTHRCDALQCSSV